jgi:hypothetical protein
MSRAVEEATTNINNVFIFAALSTDESPEREAG